MLVEYVADLELLNPSSKGVEKWRIHRFVDVDALRRNAGLTGVGEAANRAARRGPRKVGVRLDDGGRVAAQLEGDAFGAGLRANGPAGLGAAGECDETDAWILDEDLGDFDVAGDEVDAAVRIPGRLDQLAETERRQRILGRRLERDRGAAGHRRGDFMGGQEHRKVERRNGGNRRQREAPGDRDAPGSCRNRIGGQHLSRDARGFFGAIAEHEDGAVDLGPGLRDRLACLEGQRAGEVGTRRLEAVRDFPQRVGTGVGRQLAAGACGLNVGVEGGADIRGACQRHDADFAAVVRRANHRRFPFLLFRFRRHRPNP